MPLRDFAAHIISSSCAPRMVGYMIKIVPLTPSLARRLLYPLHSCGIEARLKPSGFFHLQTLTVQRWLLVVRSGKKIELYVVCSSELSSVQDLIHNSYSTLLS
jgi:hypothetical protein